MQKCNLLLIRRFPPVNSISKSFSTQVQTKPSSPHCNNENHQAHHHHHHHNYHHRIRNKIMTWREVVEEANGRKANDPFMNEVIQRSILDHNKFGKAISYELALEFASVISHNMWEDLFISVYSDDVMYHEGMFSAERMGLLDLWAIRERDPASDGLVNPFLNFKGFKALQSHRIAHILWNQGRKDSARAIQSRCSVMYGVDIHPAAVIGKTFNHYFT